MYCGIINSVTKLHLVGYCYWVILRCTDPWILNATLMFTICEHTKRRWRRYQVLSIVICDYDHSNFGRAAAAGETPHFLVGWVLEILWRSQHMCLFSESREVVWANAVNISFVLQELWLILWGEFVDFKLQFLLVLTKKCLNKFQSM